MKTLAIIGSGDLGQQIAHYALSDKQYDKVVFFDDFTTQNEVNGCPVLGKTSEVIHAFENKQFDELLIGIGYKHLQVRKALFEKFSLTIPSDAAKNAKDNGALRDPGEITTSVIPASIIWRTITRASEVELFI